MTRSSIMVDERKGSPYLALMSSRLLLTLLALLTGFVSQSATAEPRHSATRGSEISVVAALTSEAVSSHREGLAELPVSARRIGADYRPVATLRPFGPGASTVFTGIDRARE